MSTLGALTVPERTHQLLLEEAEGLGLPITHHADLDIDLRALNGEWGFCPTRFVWVLRDSGTDIFCPAQFEASGGASWALLDEVWRNFGHDRRKYFFCFEEGRLKEVTYGEARLLLMAWTGAADARRPV